ncbi:sugar phosphate nucleotidyltransferase [Paenibacillus doosanensis]|uniref:Glucose-1-phosphate thymidylyltransferase n=1 Tax=Paenibacillus konkukensis TaxID=2020716 RepID=A0ABY4RXW4_9BACL|nr:MULTISPECIES: sugar phosphate nucleotidyltransferase [Paenibacillus]MCS7458842.1 sugar phosphate nucleotidyltransferase [Paenibacillus doosanensis]UQZ86630.1 Glucose-1-phosphate thymidylyltransferase [Paenibacillus konkukensis]
MKGVILAGGTGTRLRPMTSIVNKHLLPVGKHPMIHYAIEKMAEAGIKQVLLIIGKQSAGLYMDYIGLGQQWGVEICYKIQENAGGIAQGLALAEGYTLPGEKLLLILADNLFEDSLNAQVQKFESQGTGAHVFLKQMKDSRRYGVPVFDQGRIARILEKPANPPSDYAVTGIYLYDDQVFDIIRTLQPSARGELEITDLNNVYAERGALSHSLLSGWWVDAGTHRSLLDAGMKLLERDRL